MAKIRRDGKSRNDGEFAYKTTLPILGDEFHTSCRLHAGFNLTMIHCAD